MANSSAVVSGSASATASSTQFDAASAASQSGSNTSHGRNNSHAQGGLSGNEEIIVYMATAFLAIIAILFLLYLPRFFARIWRRSDFKSSLILSERSALVKSHSKGSAYTSDAPHLKCEKGDSPPVTPIDKKGSTSESMDSTVEVDTGSSASPIHIPSYATLLYPLSRPFTWRLSHGYSGTKLLILVTLIAVCLLVTWIAGGDPFTSPRRQGSIAPAFLPFTVALGTKNNVIGVILGVGYEKVSRPWSSFSSISISHIRS